MRERHPGTVIGILAVVLSVGGCCTGRPQDGGFLCGVAGIAGGGYDNRVREREAAASAETGRGSDLERRNTDLRHEEQRTAAEIAKTRREVNDLDRSLAATSKKIHAAEAAHTTDAAALQKAKAELRDLQQGTKKLQQQANPSDDQLQLLKRRQHQLELLLEEQ